MRTLSTPSREGRKAERALQKAVARVIDESRRLVAEAKLNERKGFFETCADGLRRHWK